ncbi:MAG TPA: UTRA domain-containing protein, partial [Anaerolineae bacterium]|nr:UTRA domain-containing protein [Anaerolineae bacterium]
PPRDSVFSHTQKLGFKPTSKVREVEVEPASIPVAQKLNLQVEAPVYRFVRTRYVNGEALANQTNYIPFEICPELENDDVSHYSFQKLLEEKYLTFTAELEESFELVPASAQDMEILNLPPASSVLLVQRISLSATGYPLVWSNIRIRPDRYQYVSKLWPSAAEVLIIDDVNNG